MQKKGQSVQLVAANRVFIFSLRHLDHTCSAANSVQWSAWFLLEFLRTDNQS